MYAQLILLLALGLPIAFIDVKTHRIPNHLLVSCLAGTLALRLVFDRSHLLHSLEVGVSAILFSAILFLITRRRIGMGDLKLISVLGFVLADYQRGVFAWFATLILGLVTALFYRKRTIPFAPALILGALLTI